MAVVNIEIVQGRGSVQAKRNNNIVATINPADGLVPVQYNIGDTFEFNAFPETCITTGSCVDTTKPYSFQKYCGNVSCAITTTNNPFSGSITVDTGYLGVYFSGTPATLAVNIQQGQGTVTIYRNERLLGKVNSSSPSIFDFFINDEFKMIPEPSPGFTFSKFCGDTNCVLNTTNNPFIGNINNVSGTVLAYFNQASGSNSLIEGALILAGLGVGYLLLSNSGKPKQ